MKSNTAVPRGPTPRRGHDYNIGIVTGGGLVAIEYSGQKGMEQYCLQALFSLAETYRVQTPDGMYVFYKTDRRIPSRAFAPGVNVHGEGSYVVGAGSVVGGKKYEALTALRPVAQLAPLPELIERLITRRARR